MPCWHHGRFWSPCVDWIMEKKIDGAAYEKNLNQDVKIPSIKKKIDNNDKTEYWPTSIN